MESEPLYGSYLWGLNEMLYVKPMFKTVPDGHYEEPIIGVSINFITWEEKLAKYDV